MHASSSTTSQAAVFLGPFPMYGVLSCNNGLRALRTIRKEIGNAGKMDLMMVDMADFG